ncbi:MAG: endonuclease Q family protein [candidate division WOR-3 bacterium]
MYIADLHIHSKYSRATSPDMDIENLSRWAKLKGINLLGTGDITHPEWLKNLRNLLKPSINGIFEYDGVDFILSGEVSLVYSKYNKTRKIHIVVCFPDFESVLKFNQKISPYGSLKQDGRPILSLETENFVEILLSACSDAMIIPAHIWTPWFSLFGSNSGFDKIEECFGKYLDKVTALETGLSSDPEMNWRIKEIDNFSLVSNSDSHSPLRIGREANCFKERMDYFELKRVLKEKDNKKFLFTIEFYPEEGKYHYDGHRKCGVSMHPEETIKNGYLCPVCEKPLTIGVLHRVIMLSTRKEGEKPPKFVPFKNLVPLDEIISEAIGVNKESKIVRDEYLKMISYFGNEMEVLMNAPIEEIENKFNFRVAKGIKNVRENLVKKIPGYDGVYGKICVLGEKEEKEETKEKKQMSLF